jgi:hypothetical protein
MATPAGSTAATSTDLTTISPFGEILRDISRGGIAGLLVGLVGAGVGGRIAMRLAALLVPTSAGSLTQNGNRIGEITLSGSLGLLLTGAVIGLLAGTVWVVVSPWIPGTGLGRALLVAPIAVSLGAIGLIEANNPDFSTLQHDPRVVAVLLVLVAMIGFLFPLVDGWLDRRLPHVTRGRTGLASTYGLVTAAGAVLILPPAVLGYLQSSSPGAALIGIALFGVGFATLWRWFRRLGGEAVPTRTLTLAGRASLLAAVLAGYAATITSVGVALSV